MPGKFDLLYLAGRSCSRRDPDRAITILEQAGGLRSDYLPLHLRLGGLYEKAQRAADAKRAYERANGIKPTSHAHVGLGRIALVEGKVGEAIGHFEKARDLTPEYAVVYASLAEAYARSGRAQDAARASAMAGALEREQGFEDPIWSSIAREAVSFSSVQDFGIAALRGREFGEALAAFDRALAMRPDDLDTLGYRAQALLALNRPAEAEPILDRVLAARPKDATALAFRAGCSMARNDLPGAVIHLRQALAIDPGLAQARWNLAKALRGLNQTAEARQHLELLVERRPWMNEARVLLATILAESGSKAEALAQLEQVLSRDPSNAQALDLRRRIEGR
jgi:tetratricopeptide (TPR) repeat protein